MNNIINLDSKIQNFALSSIWLSINNWLYLYYWNYEDIRRYKLAIYFWITVWFNRYDFNQLDQVFIAFLLAIKLISINECDINNLEKLLKIVLNSYPKITNSTLRIDMYKASSLNYIGL